LKLTLEPIKDIYSNGVGLMMKFVFTARTRVKLCLDRDLLSQMQVDIVRSGDGKIPLQPLVITDNSELFQRPMQVRWLDPGQTVALRANLKRYQFGGGYTWGPGEYTVGATFNLCEQTPTEEVDPAAPETLVRSAGRGWFMIMM
jgi:hypothetical protein